NASRREGYLPLDTSILRGFVDCGVTSQDDHVSKGDLFAEFLADGFELVEHLCKLLGLIDFPILLGSKANARAVRTAALVGASKRRCRCPSGRNEIGGRNAGGEDLRLQ